MNVARIVSNILVVFFAVGRKSRRDNLLHRRVVNYYLFRESPRYCLVFFSLFISNLRDHRITAFRKIQLNIWIIFYEFSKFNMFQREDLGMKKPHITEI